MHILYPFFKPRSYVSIPKVDLGGGESTGSLCRSSRCGDIEYTAFYALIITCFFNLLMRYDWLYLLGFSGSNSLNLTTPLAGLESSLQAYLTLWFWECGNDIHYVRAV